LEQYQHSSIQFTQQLTKHIFYLDSLLYVVWNSGRPYFVQRYVTN